MSLQIAFASILSFPTTTSCPSSTPGLNSQLRQSLQLMGSITHRLTIFCYPSPIFTFLLFSLSCLNSMFSDYNHSLVSTLSSPAFHSLCSTFLAKPACILFTSNLSPFPLLPRQCSWTCWRKTHHIPLNITTNVKWAFNDAQNSHRIFPI